MRALILAKKRALLKRKVVTVLCEMPSEAIDILADLLAEYELAEEAKQARPEAERELREREQDIINEMTGKS